MRFVIKALSPQIAQQTDPLRAMTQAAVARAGWQVGLLDADIHGPSQPRMMGALQQMQGQVQWGELDVLIVDLPPGTGDVHLTLCTKSQLTGALVVSTPQDVALLDARKALDMFATLKTPVPGLIENMSTFVCPDCGHGAHIFGPAVSGRAAD